MDFGSWQTEGNQFVDASEKGKSLFKRKTGAVPVQKKKGKPLVELIGGRPRIVSEGDEEGFPIWGKEQQQRKKGIEKGSRLVAFSSSEKKGGVVKEKKGIADAKVEEKKGGPVEKSGEQQRLFFLRGGGIISQKRRPQLNIKKKKANGKMMLRE